MRSMQYEGLTLEFAVSHAKGRTPVCSEDCGARVAVQIRLREVYGNTAKQFSTPRVMAG